MDKKNDLAEIQNLPIAELSELLGALTAPELVELRKLEVASTEDGGRKGALEAIDKAYAQFPPEAGDQNQGGGEGNDDAGKRVEGGEAAVPEGVQPDWQKPEYTGPLHIEQAEWRRVNIKPVREVSTK